VALFLYRNTFWFTANDWIWSEAPLVLVSVSRFSSQSVFVADRLLMADSGTSYCWKSRMGKSSLLPSTGPSSLVVACGRCRQPKAAFGAYSTCNEYAAVVKWISRQRNTRLRASQYLQIFGNIALMLPWAQLAFCLKNTFNRLLKYFRYRECQF
jgi:hypothetical protein